MLYPKPCDNELCCSVPISTMETYVVGTPQKDLHKVSIQNIHFHGELRKKMSRFQKAHYLKR